MEPSRLNEPKVALVERIEREIAPIEVAVSDIGANVRLGITDTTSRAYDTVWEMACFGGFLMARERWPRDAWTHETELRRWSASW